MAEESLAGDTQGQTTEKTSAPATSATSATDVGVPQRPPELSSDYDAYWDAKDGVKWGDLTGELKTLRAAKAEADIRHQGVPEKAEGYELKPATFKPPEGSNIKIDPDHPAAKPAMEWAHKWGLPQEAFAELLDVQAGAELAGEAKFNEAAKAERAKLGDKAEARVSAVVAALKGRLGDELAASLNSTLFTARSIEAVEKLLRSGPTFQPSKDSANQSNIDRSNLKGAERFFYADRTLRRKAG